MRGCCKVFLYTLACAGLPAQAADRIFADEFENPVFRGTNLVGMEMAYFAYDPATGPVADTNYPVYDTRVVDYFAGKRVTAFRFLFSWEAMQAALYGPIPTPDTPASGTNYADYFANYKRIVDYATHERGIRVIVEPWQANGGGGAGGAMFRGELVGSADVPTAAFADFWGKMAAQFKDNPLVAYGLVNEPNNMSTYGWFVSAQAAIDAIRGTGAAQRIYVPGNGYTAASAWTSNFYDTDAPAHSNADGWLHANGGQPLSDPLDDLAVEVHTYVDTQEGGLDDSITSVTAARDHVSVTLDWANANGYKVYLGEIGMYAGAAGNGFTAADAWSDFVSYFDANQGPLVGYTWWGGGMPDWWHDLHGPHFAISPTDDVQFTGDTVNMTMIENDF